MMQTPPPKEHKKQKEKNSIRVQWQHPSRNQLEFNLQIMLEANINRAGTINNFIPVSAGMPSLTAFRLFSLSFVISKTRTEVPR